MALYLGSSGKRKVILGGITYESKFFTNTDITNGIKLLSSENLILTDANGLYLTVEDGDEYGD